MKRVIEGNATGWNPHSTILPHVLCFRENQAELLVGQILDYVE